MVQNPFNFHKVVRQQNREDGKFYSASCTVLHLGIHYSGERIIKICPYLPKLISYPKMNVVRFMAHGVQGGPKKLDHVEFRLD